jgi:hypothetical protein
MTVSDSIAKTKIEVMDGYLDGCGGKLNSFEIFRVVKQVFGIDLNALSVLSQEEMATSSTPLSRVVIDSYLNHYEKEMTGVEIRTMINHFFGVNLDGIASLEKARISLYSKDQWIIQSDRDLFIVHTGTGDVDVKVFPTVYFTEQTGLEELPNDLQQSLIRLGYSFDVKIGSYYFSNPTGQAIPDAFKGQTMGAIVEAIRNLRTQL